MHIPRQADGSRAVRPDAAAADEASGAGAAVAPTAGADVLRARRRHLVQQLRSVVYWQRLVQARTDLLVAGLLYSCPTPGPTRLSAEAGADPLAGLLRGPSPVAPLDLPGAAGDDLTDVDGFACPPEGMDLDRLLGGISAPGGDAGPGEHLGRLRGTARLLATHRRDVQGELDVVTLALHEKLAADGEKEATLAR